MKKQFLPLLIFPFVLFSCNKPTTDMPKSPFNDSYNRIGMISEYDVNVESLPAQEYAKLKKSVDEYGDQNKNATKFVRKEETRDLKYAYFGKEISSVSLCSMLSRIDTESRYVQGSDKDNYVTTREANSSLQNQTANAGIIKTDSTTVDYIYDTHYVDSTLCPSFKTYYGVRTSIKNNDEAAVVTQTTPETTAYDRIKFDLKPYEDIKENFNQGRTEPIDFHILGNSAVTGTCEIDGKERYIIKEGYSAFAPYTTTVGRTYKAVDNYFYEGLLEKYNEPTTNEKSFRFISFRFYHELLILSKAYDAGVPVLYLEKPVIVDFSEIKYEISYDDLGPCEVVIPEPTK